MGRILKYVFILSNLSLIFGVQIYKEPSQGHNYEKEKRGNFTPSFKQPLGENEKLPPLGFQGRKRPPAIRSGQMAKSPGLQAFASENTEWKLYKRNFSDQKSLKQQKTTPYFPQSLYPKSNSKKTFSSDYHGKIISSQKHSRFLDQNHSISHQNNKTEDNRRHYHGRSGRNHQRLAKICDPCNSVPWVPLLKVPDSYRQHRTHLREFHPTPQQNFNFDYHTYASNTQNVLLPPVPLVPPLEPIYDGTISSSFGLPIGNIPTSHGLLAPINHLAPKINKYGGDTFDHNNGFGYFPTQDLLESNPFPELSPLPIVPIHDSGQFYHIDSTIPDLVPPPNKPADVSNVVLTIAESDPAKQSVEKPNRDLSASAGYHNSQSTILYKVPSQSSDFGKLEIVKSVPLAEFTSANDYNPSRQSNLPLYPPLQSESSNRYYNHKEEPVDQKSANNQSSYNIRDSSIGSINDKNLNQNNFSNTWKDRLKESEEASTAPKPLTSPSLSWLFSDHTAPPGFGSAASIPSFVTEVKELASVVNNELRPVSPQPLPVSSTGADASKSKKIQIIIPYTTKSKNGYDNNALESVQHEIFQPLVSESTFESNLSRDLASSTNAFLPNREPQTKTNRGKVIDGREINKSEKQPMSDDTGKYLSEMHHIIASNIRELLREEIEKTQSDQNYPLQNNIDNWTALEYSNHKTVETKAPKEIITQALAVTSIPGTSISHLLLPSKKIPNEYFATTPTLVYDEPSSAAYNVTDTTVNSRPFTAKPYATTNVYVPTSIFRGNNQQNKENGYRGNHEKNYTDVERGRVNNWGRLNENLVVPEPKSKSRTVPPIAITTPSTVRASAWTSGIHVSDRNEKVQIVTPVSVTPNRTQTPAFRRTTRHVHYPESPSTFIPAVTNTVNVTQKPYFLRKLNSTKLEKISNLSLPFSRNFSLSKFSKLSTRTITTVTTAAPERDVENSTKSVLVLERTKQLVSLKESDVKTHTTGSPNMSNVNFRKTQQISINDIFPFRNKELPWESNSNSSQHNFRVGRQRKSLIKQANLPKLKAADVPS